MGRNTVYVQDDSLPDGAWVHENDAAIAFARRMAGAGISYSDSPREGKIDFHSTCAGLLQVDLKALERFNLVPNIMCATRQNYALVEDGRLVAGTRAIPLFLSRENFSRALSAACGAASFTRWAKRAFPEKVPISMPNSSSK